MSKSLSLLTLELARRKALVLDRYPDPTPIDKTAALAASTEKTKMGAPVVKAWTYTTSGPQKGWFTKHRDFTLNGFAVVGSFFDTEYEAAVAHRNFYASRLADRLVEIDTTIGLTPITSNPTNDKPAQDLRHVEPERADDEDEIVTPADVKNEAVEVLEQLRKATAKPKRDRKAEAERRIAKQKADRIEQAVDAKKALKKIRGAS